MPTFFSPLRGACVIIRLPFGEKNLNHRNDARRGCRAVFETLELRQLLAGSYLIGNSMTDGVRYNGLTALLGRDGSSVTLGRQTGPGYSQAYNLNLRPGYWTSGADPARAG